MAVYDALKSPQGEAIDNPQRSAASALVLVTRFLIVLTFSIFIFGNIATFAPMYEVHLFGSFVHLWNVYPGMNVTMIRTMMIVDNDIGRNITESNQSQNVRPMYLLIFCIFPFLVGVLAVEYLRHINTFRRATWTLVWKTAMVFRVKPHLPLYGTSRFSLGEWIVGVIFVLGGNCLAFYFELDMRINDSRNDGTLDYTNYYHLIGLSFGYLAIYNMAFLMLPVTRNSAWLEFFNVSYANAVKFHRWIGFLTVLSSVLHMLAYWIYWWRTGTFRASQWPCTHCDFTDSYTGYYVWFNFFGFISTMAMILIVATSFPIVRRKAYEWFYISHWLLFGVAVFFAILHWAQIIWWIFPAGLLWLVSRAASMWNALTPVKLGYVVVVATDAKDELLQIIAKRAAPGTSPQSSTYDFSVGDFVYLNVPSVSKLQWHPLTIASSPKTSLTDFSLLLKPVGDWSSQVVCYVKECQHAGVAPVMYLDGFYGGSLEMYDNYRTLCIVSGGIGVTPMLSILDDIAARVSQNSGNWSQRVVFVYSFRELSLLQLVAPVLAKLRELDPHGEYFQSCLFLTRGDYDDTALDQHLRGNELIKAPGKVSVQTAKAQAFHEPLRSSILFRAVLFVALFAIGVIVVGAARWSNGAIQGNTHFSLWPLERAFELGVFCATIIVVFIFIYVEGVMFAPKTTAEGETDGEESGPLGLDEVAADVHSVRDLLTHLDVVVGRRADMLALLKEVLETHKATVTTTAESLLSTVGVMISGSETLKVVANDAVAALGSLNFDVHEEEFEL
ncbi:hypothetical protein BBJ28_00025036 [Nothophytophthora sp. Chile5]|nr:hypothetical protein BBJ28_00025036 [Nothophytophthora sp. Chile5]